MTAKPCTKRDSRPCAKVTSTITFVARTNRIYLARIVHVLYLYVGNNVGIQSHANKNIVFKSSVVESDVRPTSQPNIREDDVDLTNCNTFA